MRIAFLLGIFPAVSETFILRQITGLMDLGHAVDIYSEHRPGKDVPVHAEVLRYGLLDHTIYMNEHIPEASGDWEMPVWPVSGETWLPGSESPISNQKRVEAAVPHFIACLQKSAHLAFEVLDPDEYGEAARSLSALYRLSVLCSQEKKYDIVHAHFGPVAKNFRFARKLWSVPFIVTFHGYDFSTYPLQHGPDVYQSLFDTVDAVTVNSSYTRERVRELGCASNKIHNVNVGLNIDDFSFRARTFNQHEPVRILTVGRLVEKKGMEYSIRAIASVQARYPSIRYDIIGDGPLRTHLQALIRELGMEDHIFLHGPKGCREVLHLMDQAHLFLLASITAASGDQEGTPVSLMEAQACGLPVLSTLHSGIPETVLDGKSGFLVQERDVAALENRLLHLIEHAQDWPIMGRNGRMHVEAYHDIHKLNRQLVSLYEKVIEESLVKNHSDEYPDN